jgi:hypothetical protein
MWALAVQLRLKPLGALNETRVARRIAKRKLRANRFRGSDVAGISRTQALCFGQRLFFAAPNLFSTSRLIAPDTFFIFAIAS